VHGHDRKLIARHRERYAAVQALRAEGCPVREIARRLGLARGTAAKFASAASIDELLVKATRRPSILDPFKPYLGQRWNDGITSATAAPPESSRLTPGTTPRRPTAAALQRSRAVEGAARRSRVTAIAGNVCSGRGSGRDGGCVPVGAAAHRCAVLQQQERHVIVGVTAGVPVYGSHQGIQCLITVRCEERRCDRVFREEVPAGIAAFDKPVGVEQQPVAGRPGRGERGVIIGKAERRGGLAVGQRPQVAAVAQ
jgi:hypothetical protein